MSAGVLLLILAAVLVVLLLVHRSDGDLGRAAGEYALVAVFALLLASTPATSGMTAGVTSGVTGGSQVAAGLVSQAWRTTFGGPAAASAVPPESTRPARKRDRPRAARPTPPATSATEPARLPATPGAPGRALLLAVLGALALLVLAARRVRHHDQRHAEELALPRLPRRGRRRAA
jgi:hypothetical protein